MDLEVTWSHEAIEDLEAIATYIARDSEYYARSVVTEIVSASRNVGEFPQLGRIVPETGDERVRERFVYSYRLIYQLQARQVLIVAVIHGKRLLENIEGRFKDSS
jgi:plasmid stabilization system protein ParE